MLIEIPFMSLILCLFTQFIYVHITIYRNLTPNITKGQKRVKKGSKIGQKMVKIKNAHRNTIYECIFWHVYIIYKCTYDNLQEFEPKYNQRLKKGKKMAQKKGKKKVKIKNADRNTIQGPSKKLHVGHKRKSVAKGGGRGSQAHFILLYTSIPHPFENQKYCKFHVIIPGINTLILNQCIYSWNDCISQTV